MMLVDSHCHLNYKGLREDVAGAVDRAGKAGVGAMLNISTTLAEYDAVHAIARHYEHVFCSVGVHPHEAEREQNVGLDALLSRAADTKTVGIGETGLDYFYDHAPRAAQQASFRTHIRAARESGLPLIVHTRDADNDTALMLTEEMGEGAFTGVIHCFTASQAFAETALGLGFYISLSGILTFKNAKDLQAIARTIPEDRLLVETDAPFLAPVPVRGQICEPAYVAHTARFLAQLRGVSLAHLADVTSDNFFRLFSKARRPEVVAS